MHKSRRDFLSLAGRMSLMSATLAAAGGRAFATGLDPNVIVKPLSQSATGMPLPHDVEPGSNLELFKRIKAISNVFEVGRAEPDYAYVENLGDGRGYTVTQYGFCTYNNEVSDVIARYAEDAPATPLKRFLPHLPPLTHDVSTEALKGLPEIWRREIKASAFLANACDEEADKLYFRPALAAAEQAGIRSAIGKSIFYDTWLQHGASSDPDSLVTILKRTTAETGGIGTSSEADFLRAFLTIRKSVLHEPHNRATRAVWRASARRVDALLHLLDSNPDLDPPVEVTNADIHVVVL
jgi:chitosanase